MTEDEMVGWHHRLDGHEFEQASGVGDGQGGLVCCSPWGRKESDTTERLNLLTDLGSVLTMIGDSLCCVLLLLESELSYTCNSKVISFRV